MIIDKNYPDLEKCKYMEGYQIDHSIMSNEDLIIDLDGPLYVVGGICVKGNLYANAPLETGYSCILIDGNANAEELCGEDVVLKVGGNLTAKVIDCTGVIVRGDVKISEFLKCACAAIYGDVTSDIINCAEDVVVRGDVHANKIWFVDEVDCGENVEDIVVGGNIECSSVYAEEVFENHEDIDKAFEDCIAEIESWGIDFED